MRRQALLGFVALLVSLGPLCAQDKKPVEDPIVNEFKKYWNSEDPMTRRDQVERLSKSTSPEAIALLTQKGLMDADSRVRDRAIWALSQIEAPHLRALVVQALDSQKPETREGVALAIGAMKDLASPPLAKLGELIQIDRSPQVKVAAAEALGMIGGEGVVPYLTTALTATDESVLIAACDATAMVKHASAGLAVLALLDHPAWRVQVAALNALSSIRIKESIGPIIEYLRDAEGRPREDARRALVKITKRTFGMDAKTWQGWWGRVKEGWQVPPETEKDPDEDDSGGGYARKPTNYHRIPTYSQRVLFVIDVSTSMETPILLKAGKKTEGSDPIAGAARKIDIAREELAFALRGMDPETKFNIIAFETDVRQWQKEAISANPGNVQNALRWLGSQQPRKPSGQSSGIDSEGRMVGRTNSYAAIRAAFGLTIKRGGTPGSSGGTTSGHASRGPKPGWDTCYFLSDGVPTEGEMIDIPSILQDVDRWNKSAKMVIHTVGMEESAGLQELLQGLARITGGKCVFVGR